MCGIDLTPSMLGLKLRPLQSTEESTAPQITLLHCNNCNLATFIHFVTDCLTLMGHLLNPYNHLQEMPLSNTDLSWFIDGSYLKGDSSKYYVGSAIVTPFGVVEVGCLPIATSVQHTELHTLTWACTLAKEKKKCHCLY